MAEYFTARGVKEKERRRSERRIRRSFERTDDAIRERSKVARVIERPDELRFCIKEDGHIELTAESEVTGASAVGVQEQVNTGGA